METALATRARLGVFGYDTISPKGRFDGAFLAVRQRCRDPFCSSETSSAEVRWWKHFSAIADVDVKAAMDALRNKDIALGEHPITPSDKQRKGRPARGTSTSDPAEPHIRAAAMNLQHAHCALDTLLRGENEMKRLLSPEPLKSAARREVFVVSSLIMCHLALKPPARGIAEGYLPSLDFAYERATEETAFNRTWLHRTMEKGKEFANGNDSLPARIAVGAAQTAAVFATMIPLVVAGITDIVIASLNGLGPDPPSLPQFKAFKQSILRHCSEG